MKKKILLILAVCAMMLCTSLSTVSAATINFKGNVQTAEISTSRKIINNKHLKISPLTDKDFQQLFKQYGVNNKADLAEKMTAIHNKNNSSTNTSYNLKGKYYIFLGWGKVTGDGVNLRTGPGTNYRSQGLLSRGTFLAFYCHFTRPSSNNYCDVNVNSGPLNGRMGYVSTRYCSITDPAY